MSEEVTVHQKVSEDAVVVKRFRNPTEEEAETAAEQQEQEEATASGTSFDPQLAKEVMKDEIANRLSAPPPARPVPPPAEPKEQPDAAEEMVMDFAELLEMGMAQAEFKVGDRVRGTIVAISSDVVFVDVGTKSEASIEKRELMRDGEMTVAVGDDLEAQVVGIDHEGVRLSMGALKAQQLSSMLEEAASSSLPVEGKVVGYNDGGLEVRLGGRRAFCPKSQIDRGFTEDLASWVGQDLRCVITRFDPTGRHMVVSRRTLLEREAKEMAAETRERLEEGAIVEGIARKITDFGVFVDLGGLDGLVHISELSWSRVAHPHDVVQAGQAMRVKVLKIDAERDRISLSLKQAQDKPEGALSRTDLSEGSILDGRVTRVMDFGAFVEIAPGIEGLVHVTELDWTKRIEHPSEVLQEGQEIQVLLMEIDHRKRRYSLSLKRVAGDPWADALKDIHVGQMIEVTVEKAADFGVFCTVAEGITGLMPNSHTNLPRGANIRRKFYKGVKTQVRVIAIDKRARKITLSKRDDGAEGVAEDMRLYRKQLKQEQAEAGPSAMALALMAAMGKDD